MRTQEFVRLAVFYLLFGLTPAIFAGEIHVSVHGSDANDGSPQHPLKSISAAARIAMPGDIITVHEGTYRERVDPPRGGESDQKRIVYQASPGEKVEIKGSEVIKNWTHLQGDLWMARILNAFFGKFNPYSDTIHGDWFDPLGRQHHTGAVYLNGDWLNEAASRDEVAKPVGNIPLWFAEVDTASTTIWAQFKGVDPNKELVEINVRKTVFWPEKTGINYITVRGFIMRQAATNWAPPTAEQIGLIGPHWSKGWIIENNVVSHSRCSGVSLGKYGDEWDNTSANSAEGYVKTIERAHERGWNGDLVGHHIVRNNTISDCEQTGIVGSLGAIFSRIEGNHIYNIWARRLFTGAEIAGIKIHAAIDVVIKHNRIHDAGRGLWLDWMAQGTRVTANLFYHHTSEDIFVEVDHGPFLIDNNLLLSPCSLSDASEGGACVHNLIAGGIHSWPDLGRETPYHPAHSTAVAGFSNVKGGDDRFYNNIFAPADASIPPEQCGLRTYDTREYKLQTGGNVYYDGACPYAHESGPLLIGDANPHVQIVEKADEVFLRFDMSRGAVTHKVELVSTARLGKARISGVAYENPDGSPLAIDSDYFGKPRDKKNLSAGPFASPAPGLSEIKVW
ncbi:MAG TPA: right-handed parallel beta-helix repeat-containing protein [Bacteroidota bacterium]|nr:right-handed parallel beta-helix repeat-containing protein [Bacteroidota bacterium]